jgi:molecular chaperone DnaJ
MDPKKDYYRILGVPEGASAEEIRKAFRRLAKKHHPDVNPGDKAAESRFKEANEAHEILSDRKKREEYDAIRQGGFAGGFQGAGPFGGAGHAPGGFRAESFDFGDLFGDVLRGGGARFSHPGRGSDIRVEISVDFLDMVRGGSERSGIPGPACAGSAEEPAAPGGGGVLYATDAG